MVRSRGRGKVVVDLVESSGTSGAGDVADAESVVEASVPPPPTGMTRRQRTIQASVAIGVIVVVGAGVGVTSAVREHARTERLRDAPGGVLSLDEPPQPVWTVAGDLFQPAHFLPGVVVQQRSDELVGLDAGTGAERWHVPFQGGYASCGVWNTSTDQPVHDRLVCLRAIDDDDMARPIADEPAWSVVVLDASGVVATRDVAGPLDAAWPTGDGGLVTVRLVGQDPAPVAATSNGAGVWTAGPVEQGYDAQVHAEDAATGETRWDVTVPFRPVEGGDLSLGSSCFLQSDDTPEFQPRMLSAWGSAATFVLNGCGLRATLTLDGAVLDDGDPDDPDALDTSYGPYADGGVLGVLYGDSGSLGVRASTLHDASGATIQRFDDLLLSPLATDGTGADVRIVEAQTTRLRAFDGDGAPLWESDVSASSLLVRAAGVAVVQRQDGGLTGLDLATGKALWAGTEHRAPLGSGVNAFTDGRTALVVTVPYDVQSTTVSLTALDLHTGEVRWSTEFHGVQLQLLAVQGRLVQVAPTDITWETTEYGSMSTAHGQELSLLR